MDDDAIQFVRVTSAAVSGDTRASTVQVAALGDESDTNAGQRFDGVEVCQPLGLIASPTITRTTEAVCVRRGDELVALALIDKGAASQSAESGETRLYGAGTGNATAVCRIRASGAIEVTSKSSEDIVLNGGSLKVARVSDPTNAAASMLTWISQVTAALNALPPGSAPVPPIAPPTDFGIISTSGGATRVKA